MNGFLFFFFFVSNTILESYYGTEWLQYKKMLPFCSFHMYLHTPTMMKSSITVSRPTVVKLVLFLSEGVVCSICFVLGIDFLDNLQKVLEQDFKSFSILNYTKFYFNKWNVSGVFFITDGRHYNARIITQSTWTIDMLVIML